MSYKHVLGATALAAVLATTAAIADDNHGGGRKHHILLISIDGMHAVDYLNCTTNRTCPTLFELGANGVNYTRTSTSQPSDSFPGLMSILTGASPQTMGVWYDVAYDRVLAPPTVDTGNGVAGGTCTTGQVNGTRTEYEEGIDYDQTLLNGGNNVAYPNPIDGGYLSINPQRLIRDPFNNCNPVYPWNFIRVNTIFGVIHKANGYTAWSDKHAAYSSVSGPTGTSVPSNVDDYYAPDINSNVVGIPGLKTATGVDCSSPHGTGDWTTDFDAVKCNDQLKVNAVVNQINGRDHLNTKNAPVPVLFGMNFQAVSVGQKLVQGAVKGGYTDAAATPTMNMLGEIEYVDAAIGQMVAALKKNGLLDSTTIIITAKHGQSPIDTNRFNEIPGTSSTNPNGMPPSSVLGLTYLTDSQINQIGPTEDDISLLWLKPGADTIAAANLLEHNASAIGLGQIFYGPTIEVTYNKPGLPPAGDPRTPDIIVEPNYGVVYSTSGKKQAEHGGFAHDDTNVMLLVSDTRLKAGTVVSFVETKQVGPTILSILGLDPKALQGVQIEKTPLLPGLPIAGQGGSHGDE